MTFNAPEQHARSALAAAPDATLIMDRHGKIVFASDLVEGLFGYPSSELLGQAIEVIVPARFRAAHLRDRATFMSAPKPRPMGEGMRLFGLHKDGHEIAVEVSLSPLGEGEDAEVICAVRDVSQRIIREAEIDQIARKKEQAAAENTAIAKQSLRLFVKHAPAAVAMLDKQMRYMVVSNRWLADYGLDGRDIIGLCHYDVFPELPERWKEAHRRCLAGKVLQSAEDSFVRPDGTLEWLHWELVPWHTLNGSIGGIMLFSEVITKRKLAELELAASHKDLEQRVLERTLALETAKNEANRASAFKSRFLAAVSHDLRQPLQTIGLLHGVIEKRIDDSLATATLAKLNNAVTTMAELLDTLLDINQIESGVIEPEIRDVRLADLLSQVADEFAPLAAAKGLQLRVVASSATVRSDRRLLARMVSNLLSNAIKYTDEGKVLLGCRRRGGALRIEVLDTGLGIPAANIPNIFEEFYRVDRSDSDKVGLGLGLSIVQSFAQILGHKVYVETTPSRGAAFAIEIADASFARTAKRIGPDGRDVDAPPTVLLLEDDTAQLDALRMLLELEGYGVTAERRSEEALARLRAEPPLRPDFIIADYNLPGGRTGLDVILAARAASKIHIPAMIVSGDRQRTVLSAIDRADVMFVAKPVKAANLLAGAAAMARLTKPAWRGRAGAHPRRAIEAPPAADPTIAVIEDEPGVRAAIAMMLEAEGYAVAAYPSAEAFFSDADRRRYRCLIADVNLPLMNGLELLDRLRSERSAIPIIFVTGGGDLTIAVNAMRQGAADFLQKPVRGEALKQSVAQALKKAEGDVRTVLEDADVAVRLATLTDREREVMDKVVAGTMNKNIAADLGISQRTAEHHRQSVMRKMGATSLAKLVLMVGPTERGG